jgi:hypothetical protein
MLHTTAYFKQNVASICFVCATSIVLCKERTLDYLWMYSSVCGWAMLKKISSKFYLTLWCRNFLLNFSAPVFKIWIIQQPNKVALWNYRHFEERKTEIMHLVSNIQYGYLLNKYLKCSVWRLAVQYGHYSGLLASKG